jgi:hypothetical protein
MHSPYVCLRHFGCPRKYLEEYHLGKRIAFKGEHRMKRLLYLITILALAILPAMSEEAKRKPENLTMTLAWIADAGEQQPEHIFVINGVVAYKTVEGLKKYLMELPEGSTLTWDPGCDRLGNEPLLGSKEEMKKFKDFCEAHSIKFVLVPAG